MRDGNELKYWLLNRSNDLHNWLLCWLNLAFFLIYSETNNNTINLLIIFKNVANLDYILTLKYNTFRTNHPISQKFFGINLQFYFQIKKEKVKKMRSRK